MPRVSGTSNPTNLREIAKKHISLSRMDIDGRKVFQVAKLDFSKYSFSGSEKIFLIARAGNTSRRYELGTVDRWNQDAQDLDGLDFSKPLRFRLLVRKHDSPKLIASAENLRCSGDGDIESLLPIISTDLGQRLWRLVIGEDGAELQCNEKVFPSGASAEGYPPFRALVLPEALRQVLEYLANDPERVSEDDSVWLEWGVWMRYLRIEVPPPHEKELKHGWVEDSTARFCDHFKTAEDLQAFLGQGGLA
jgi:hypothetical protein